MKAKQVNKDTRLNKAKSSIIIEQNVKRGGHSLLSPIVSVCLPCYPYVTSLFIIWMVQVWQYSMSLNRAFSKITVGKIIQTHNIILWLEMNFITHIIYDLDKNVISSN